MTNTITNAGARPRPRRRKATLEWRAPQDPRKRDKVMTKIDCLIEVAKKLKEARTLGEACSDRALIYFIDMTIVHVCDSLGDRRQPQEGAEARLDLVHAS